jgi:shikimate dehydrogenase
MKRFGLIGKTLKHSFSKNYFTQKFAEQRIIDCTYENFELQSIDELPALIQNNPDIKGLNITIPYKEEALAFLNEKNEIVEAVCACNCIKIEGGKTYGYNTDVIGFKNSLQPHLMPHHKCALILGSGGASKAVQYALKELNIGFLIVSRHKKYNQIGYEDLGKDIIEGHQLIINSTPLGMYPNIQDDPPIPYEYISSQHLLYDLIYNPVKTKFLEKGEKQGAKIINGYEMLILQAEESWRIWNHG